MSGFWLIALHEHSPNTPALALRLATDADSGFLWAYREEHARARSLSKGRRAGSGVFGGSTDCFAADRMMYVAGRATYCIEQCWR